MGVTLYFTNPFYLQASVQSGAAYSRIFHKFVNDAPVTIAHTVAECFIIVCGGIYAWVCHQFCVGFSKHLKKLVPRTILTSPRKLAHRMHQLFLAEASTRLSFINSLSTSK